MKDETVSEMISVKGKKNQHIYTSYVWPSFAVRKRVGLHIPVEMVNEDLEYKLKKKTFER